MDDKMKLLEQLAEKYARRFNSSQGYDGDSLSPEDRIEMRAYVEGFKAAEEISIEFAEWRDTRLEELNKWTLDGVLMGNKFTTKELYGEFIKTKIL